MTETIEMYKQIERERLTEKKVRDLDACEIVEWIHKLEDQIERLEKTIEEKP